MVEVGTDYKFITYQYQGDGTIVQNENNIQGTHGEVQSRQALLLANFASRIELSFIENDKIKQWIKQAQPQNSVFPNHGPGFALMEVGTQTRIIHYEIGNNGTAYHDGDIILGSHQQLQSRQAELLAQLAINIPLKFIKDEKIKQWLIETQNLPSPDSFLKGAFRNNTNKWSDNTITYYFDKSLSQPLRNRVKKAAKIWNKSGINVKIVNSAAPDINFLRIYSGSECGSNIGAVGNTKNPVVMELATKCTSGTIIHEFFHVAGFIHEHQRDIRNKYLKWASGFGTSFNEGLQSAENQTNYDICSISHYGEINQSEASKPRRFTITTAGKKAIQICRSQFSGNPIIPGQRQKLSKLDIAAINSKYP